VKHIIAAKKLFRKQIGMSGEKITIKRLRDEVAKGRADESSTRCFFMIEFNRLVFSTTAYDVSNTDVMLTDLEKIASIDWFKIVVQDIIGAASAFGRTVIKSLQMPGCMDFICNGDYYWCPHQNGLALPLVCTIPFGEKRNLPKFFFCVLLSHSAPNCI
jgi:hypothetical protein